MRAVEAERVHGRREVVDELPARRGLEVEHGDDLVALHDHVVVEAIAVDDALRELRLEVVREIVDLVVERSRDPLEVRGEATTNLAVQVGDTVEAEAVLDTLLVALADRVQVRERAPDALELRARHAVGAERMAVVPAVDGETLPGVLAIVASLAVRERLRAREAVLAEEEEEVELAL